MPPRRKLRPEPAAAHAEVLTETTELERVRQLLTAHYKITY